jgi:hypothetical protein
MKQLRALVMFLMVSMLAACGGQDESGGDTVSGEPPASVGVLSLKLTDAPAAPVYREVWVTIDRIRVHGSESAAEGEAGWREIDASNASLPMKVDLLTLRNGKLRDLGDIELPAGRYEQMRLVLGVQPGDNEAVVELEDGSLVTRELTIPAAAQAGLKIVHAFDVDSTKATELVLDFDAARSLVEAGKSGRLLLQPVINVIARAESGEIGGVIEKSMVSAAAGATVSVQTSDAAKGVTVLRSTVVERDGSWKLAPVPAGDRYSLVLAGPGLKTMVLTDIRLGVGETLSIPALRPVREDLAAATVTGELPPGERRDAHARALQQVSPDTLVEVGFARADAESGSFQMTLPRSAPRVASHLAERIVFGKGASAGVYQIETRGLPVDVALPDPVVSKSEVVLPSGGADIR